MYVLIVCIATLLIIGIVIFLVLRSKSDGTDSPVTQLSAAAQPQRSFKGTVLSHMTNAAKSVKWALDQGANGIEVDINFTGSEPMYVKHGGICDCSCICPFGSMCRSDNICNRMWNDTGSHCNAQTPIDEMLIRLGDADLQDKLAVVYFDNKLDASVTDLAHAGSTVATKIIKFLFARGYKGQVVINGSDPKYIAYLKAALDVATASPYNERIFYTLDLNFNDYEKSKAGLLTLGTKNIVYSTGITICVPTTYYSAIAKARVDFNAGIIQGVGIWTLDSESSMNKYLDAGVTNIMTDVPAIAVNVFKKRGIPLARPGEAFQ
jgi:hypothetical protein